jgi:hypothetical protein
MVFTDPEPASFSTVFVFFHIVDDREMPKSRRSASDRVRVDVFSIITRVAAQECPVFSKKDRDLFDFHNSPT